MGRTAAIILAAGRSTRMNSGLPKVLHEVCGRPMLHHVLQACRMAGVDSLLVVVGHGKEEVVQGFATDDDVTWVEQASQKGTGHAVQCCRDELPSDLESVLVIAGDMPLVRRTTLAALLEARAESDDAVTLATTVLDDPTGYGRIVRDASGRLEAIVEHRDCTEDQRAICEVNPSYYCFAADALLGALDEVEPDPGTGEYYLTDVVRILRDSDKGVSAVVRVPAEDAIGINSRLDLATVSRLMQDRIQFSLMQEGVTIVDPDNTWIDADTSIGRDTLVAPFSFVAAGAVVGEGCRIGPFAHVVGGAKVEDGAVVGPVMGEGAGGS